MNDAREAVLTRARRALTATAIPPEAARAYVREGGRPADRRAIAELFVARVSDYTATIHRPEAERLGETLVRLVEGERVVAVPVLLPLLPGAASDQPQLDARDLDGFGAVVTGCAVAIAETGTIVLDGGQTSGRRLLTLVPDHHVCVVRASQIVPGVPDAIAAIRRAVEAKRAVVLVSGPSATSDIELERVEGVHGPRRLDVVVVEAP
jgi:L-lactate dehydrogenase complex protein LldG